MQAPCRIDSSPMLWGDMMPDLKTCYLAINTVDDEDFTISPLEDPEINAVHIVSKKGVKFLPYDLSRVIPALAFLKVRHCSVTEISKKHFTNLTELRELDLGGNQIEYVPSDAFEDLKKLYKLDLSFNRIRFLHENTFAALEGLTNLYLYYNQIEALHPNIFSSLVNVDRIDFEGNKIRDLDENIFKNATSLESINISKNKLEMIPKNLFKNNLKIRYVYLQGIDFTKIDPTMFYHLSRWLYVDWCGTRC